VGGVQALEWSEATSWGGLQKGASFSKPKPVFKRIEDEDPCVEISANDCAVAWS
jgi:hypothetical protein